MQIKKSLLLCACALSSVAALASCGGASSDPNTLNIIVLNRGYGRAWIDDIVTKWEAANPGYKVNVNASSSAPSFIDKNISSKKNTDDVYISVGADWKKYAVAGKLLELDSFLEETIDGVSVKNKINPEYQNSIYYTNKNNVTHSYRLPWTAGIGGIYYNAAMFEANGWAVPTTYEELLTLCTTIKEAAIGIPGQRAGTVAPFVYTGQNTDYFDYAVLTWWGQLVGKQALNEFFKYESSDIFDTTKNATYAALKEAVTMWYNLFSDPTNYVEGSKSKDNHTAQQNFLNGYAAMMFDGEWIYNEILSYNTTRDDFSIKIMPTPAKTGAAYKDTAYVVGEDQYIAIPASTSKPELAKSFVKAVISNDGCRSFANEANGMLAYSWDSAAYRAETTNEYKKSVIDFRSSLTSTFTNYSSSLLYQNSIIDIWGTGALRPFESLLGTSSIDQAFETIATQTRNQWSSWLAQAGL